jgi:hypothetical protein
VLLVGESALPRSHARRVQEPVWQLTHVGSRNEGRYDGNVQGYYGKKTTSR